MTTRYRGKTIKKRTMKTLKKIANELDKIPNWLLIAVTIITMAVFSRLDII